MKTNLINCRYWVLLLVSSILIQGCISKGESVKKPTKVPGLYVCSNIFYAVWSSIHLKTDSTFTYKWQVGLMLGTTEGRWCLEDNRLTLNSFDQPNSRSNYVLRETGELRQKDFSITVLDHETKEPIWGAHCLVLEDSTLLLVRFTDSIGACNLLQMANQTHIKIMDSFLPYYYKPAIIPLDSLSSDSFVLEMKRGGLARYFTDETWRIEKDRIYDLTTTRENDEGKFDCYEKVEKR